VGVVVSLVSGRTRDQVLGDWLESIRTSTFVEHVERSGAHVEGDQGATIDDDDVAGTASATSVYLGDSAKPNNAYSLAIHEATHALDRVLQWNELVVPQWFSPNVRIAYWDRYGQPKVLPGLTPGFLQVWWFDEKLAERLPGPSKL